MGLKNAVNKLKLAKHVSAHRITSLVWWAELYAKGMGVKEVRESLKGYKSYLVAAGIGVASVAHSLGYIDAAAYAQILGLLGAGALAAIAAKVERKSPPK